MESLTVANIVIFTIKLCIFLPALQLKSCNCKYIEDNELDHQLLQDLDFATSRYVRGTGEFCPPDTGISKMPSDVKSQVVTTPENWIDASIEASNVYRRAHGVPDLIKRDDLCKVSQYYADKLVKKPVFEHSHYGCGENLYTKESSAPDFKEGIPPNFAIDAWYNEIDYYDWKTHKMKATIDVKKEPKKMVGHFTQLIWKDSKYTCIAYAITPDAKKVFVVAQYWEPGNWANEYEKNVLPKKSVPDHANPKENLVTNSEPNPKPEPNAEHKPEPVPNKEPIPEPVPNAEPKPIPVPNAEPIPEPVPNAEPKPIPVPSPEPNPKPVPNSEPKPKPISKPNSKPGPGPKCPPGSNTGTMVFCRDKNKERCVIAYTPGICINTKGGPWISGYTDGPYKCQVHQSKNCKDVPAGKDIDEKGLDDFGIKVQSFKCPCI